MSVSAPGAGLFARPEDGPWLFGRSVDLTAFGGSALASLALLALGAALGVLHGSTPVWAWLGCVVVVDVAHVWTTLFRVYLDGAELRRRRLLYLGTPVAVYLAGLALSALDPRLFWRALAYAATFHFVRQQAGWMALYQRRAAGGPPAPWLERALDAGAIYAATLYPLVYWHTHPDTPFAWMMHGDYALLPAPEIASAFFPVYVLLLLGFAARQAWRALRGEGPHWGKLLLVSTTAVCWYVGIVGIGSDYAFTVTNVLIHGVPYAVLTLRYARARAARGAPLLGRALRHGVLPLLSFVVALAFVEEALWDRHVWHDHACLFGEGARHPRGVLALLVPLLAVPQATHYVLDGMVWRRRDNPALGELR